MADDHSADKKPYRTADELSLEPLVYSWTLKSKEIAFARNHDSLFRTWGYRVRDRKTNEGHSAFELGLHGTDWYSYATTYTDPLFRNLQQLAKKNRGGDEATIVYKTDAKKIFARAQHDDLSHKPTLKKAIKTGEHIRSFLNVPGVWDVLVDYIDYDLNKATVGFAVLVYAANAIAALDAGDYAAAREIVLEYVNQCDIAKESGPEFSDSE